MSCYMVSTSLNTYCTQQLPMLTESHLLFKSSVVDRCESSRPGVCTNQSPTEQCWFNRKAAELGSWDLQGAEAINVPLGLWSWWCAKVLPSLSKARVSGCLCLFLILSFSNLWFSGNRRKCSFLVLQFVTFSGLKNKSQILFSAI